MQKISMMQKRRQNQETPMSFVRTLCTVAASSVVFFSLLQPAFVQAQVENAADAHASQASSEALSNAAQQITTAEQMIYLDMTSKASERLVKKIKNVLIDVHKSKAVDKNAAQFVYAEDFRSLLTPHTVSKPLQSAVRMKMDDVFRQVFSGHKVIENISAAPGDESRRNPYSLGNYAAAEEILYKRYNELFCIAESMNSTDDCKAKSSQSSMALYPSFHEFFIGEGTWPDKQVLDVIAMARRFFSGLDIRFVYTNDIEGVNTFIEKQGQQTRANLRMAVLNELAARRAPSAVAQQGNGADGPMNILLRFYAETGQISTTDVEALCKQEKLTPTEGYVCRMTTTPEGGSERLVSQVVIDRILQRDIYMSPSYYSALQNGSSTSEVSLDRMDVFTKAQQVAQAYRQLKLLQMKTAIYAVNMMSPGK